MLVEIIHTQQLGDPKLDQSIDLDIHVKMTSNTGVYHSHSEEVKQLSGVDKSRRYQGLSKTASFVQPHSVEAIYYKKK